MSLNLNPEIEAQLISLAQASGVSVEDFLRHVVAEKKAEGNTGHDASLSPAERAKQGRDVRPAYELPPEEWVRKFDTWAERHAALNLPVLSDEDISRESIYAERGL